MRTTGIKQTTYWGKLLESNIYQITFCFFTGLACYAPIALGIPSNLESRPLRDALMTSVEFNYSCVASIALVVPLFLDVLLDIFNRSKDSPTTEENIKPKKCENEPQRFNYLNIYERILILLGIVALPIVGLLPKNTESLAFIYVCSTKCQQVWVGGTVALSLSRYDKEYWSTGSTVFTLIILSFGLISSPFLDNLYAIGDPSTLIITLNYGTYLFTLGPCLLFLFNSFRWLVIVYFKKYSWKKRMFCCSRTTTPPPLVHAIVAVKTSDHTFFPMIYTMCGTVVIILICALIGPNSRMEYYNGNNLVQCNMPFLVFVVSISTLSMRLVKFEVVEGLVSRKVCKKICAF